MPIRGNYERRDKLAKIDLDSIFDNKKTKIHCVNCDKNFEIKLKQAFDNIKISCPHCRADNSDNLDSKTKKILKGLESDIKEIDKASKRIFGE